jgi:predicted metal-dependent enzyme (double-stranded beta helix superfamily)
MKVHELVTSFGRSSDSTNPMSAAREILESLRGQEEAVENALAYISGTGGNAGQVFYRSPQITLLKVRFPVGRRTPPHNHGTWAAILQLSGEEKNALPPREWQTAQSRRDDYDSWHGAADAC